MSGLEIAKRSVRGSLIFFVGNFSWALISAVTIIVIARMLGPSEYGVYSLALVIPNIMQLFVGFGVNNAVIRYAAYSSSAGKPEEARRFTLNAIYFMWLTGAALALLNYAVAGPFAALLLHRSSLTPYIQLLSLGVVGTTLLSSVSNAAIGWSWMSLSGFTLVAQSLVKLVLSPLLVVAGLGVAGALTGHFVSLILAGAIGTAILYNGRLRAARERGAFLDDVAVMLKFGTPLYIGGVVVNLSASYVTIVLAAIASNTVFGLFQAASNFLQPVSIVAVSLTTTLFPAFASLDGVGGDAKAAFRDAYKFVAFLLAPITIFVAASATYLIRAFYGTSFSAGAPYLQLLSLAYLPIAFGYSVHPSYFSGFGKPRLALYVYASGALTLVVFAYLLSVLLSYGVYGLIYATFMSYLAAWLVGTILAKRAMGATLDLKANLAILAVSAVAYAATTMVPTLASSSALSLFVGFLVFFGIYITLAPLAGAVDGRDLVVMEHTFKDLKLVGPVLRVLIRYERAILAVRVRSFSETH